MKIAHVVTYISPDGAFGGPATVALGQAKALAEFGHEVMIFAAAPVDKPERVLQEGYELRRFPARYVSRRLGFAGMRAVGLVQNLKGELARLDVAHVHLARDLVTLPAVRAIRKAKVPYLVQTHGMIDQARNPLALPVDAWETRKALRGARSVLSLTYQEDKDLDELVPGLSPIRISNGIEVGTIPPYEDRPNRVLYVARLHPRKRPMAFVEMAEQLAPEFPELEFLLVGPDEGEGATISAVLEKSPLGERARWIGAVSPSEVGKMMREARVHVLPAIGEVFPMTVLEAFMGGAPTVVTDSLGIAEACVRYGAAVVTDGSVESLVAAVRSILKSTEEAQRLRAGAARYLESELDVKSVAEQLLSRYKAASRPCG